jgi:hypothetical protein
MPSGAMVRIKKGEGKGGFDSMPVPLALGSGNGNGTAVRDVVSGKLNSTKWRVLGFRARYQWWQSTPLWKILVQYMTRDLNGASQE